MSVELLKKVPTTTVHQSRLQVFQPTRRPKDIERTILTPWGEAKISGKVGQVHAHIIEAMCKHAKDHRKTDIGQIQLLVDPYTVRTSVGNGKAYSGDTLWRMIQDMRKTSIELSAPSQGLRVMGGIIDLVEESLVVSSHNGDKRHLWRVTLNPAFAVLLEDDLPLHYDPAPLARLESGIAQAIVRHLITHRAQPEGGWSLDNLIRAVGAGTTSTDLRNRRREVNKDADTLQALGVLVKEGRVFKGENV